MVRGETVVCRRGGKEVHAADVARAVWLLLQAPAAAITGEAFNCCDQYISDWDVAHLARELAGSSGRIEGGQTAPKNQIETGKLRELGMVFGGRELLKADDRRDDWMCRLIVSWTARCCVARLRPEENRATISAILRSGPLVRVLSLDITKADGSAHHPFLI